MSDRIAPYGGSLVDLRVTPERAEELKDLAPGLPCKVLDQRELCDLELLAVGAFSPLSGYLGAADHASVLRDMRLAGGTLWPIPVTLRSDDPQATPGRSLALLDGENTLLAMLHVEEAYETDHEQESLAVFGTADPDHPGVADLAGRPRRCLAGHLEVVRLPRAPAWSELRRTPAETRRRLDAMGWSKVVAFQTRNPLHRAHEEIIRRAAQSVGGGVLLHPVVGATKPGDVSAHTRVRCYRALVGGYMDDGRVLLSLLPLAMRMAGPKECLWHAIIRRNYGCTHLIVGRDHASPGSDAAGKPWYRPFDAQALLAEHQAEIGVDMVPFQAVAYIPDRGVYLPADEVPPGTKTLDLSGTQVREEYLAKGQPLPSWFTRPEVARILQEAYPARWRQGLVIWFTGLSAAGKSTLARGLRERLLAHGRRVTLLDGDELRRHLSTGLGFSKEDRNAHVLRVGYVASLVAEHQGIAIAALISPYREVRDRVRALCPGNFLEVHVSTGLDECERRDPKGLYRKARQGLVKGFTGIDDPYEPPEDPEIRLDTAGAEPEACVDQIVERLMDLGYIDPREW